VLNSCSWAELRYNCFGTLGYALEQEELIGKLGTIVAQVEVADFAAPAIAVVVQWLVYTLLVRLPPV